jgi:hypothetical protein
MQSAVVPPDVQQRIGRDVAGEKRLIAGMSVV